jgi:hypothetical protein
MTNLYAEWIKLKNNVKSASARLYYEKNENTERKYEEALERLAQFEKENGIPLMADEADVKKMFCPQTNEEWFCQLPTGEKAEFFANIYPKSVGEALIKISNGDKEKWEEWLKQPHT